MRNHKITIFLVLAAIILGFFLYQKMLLKRAHATFENYYAFRGCVKLLSRTGTYGTCRLQSGKEIKLVEFRNKWYLDGDLPACYFGFCF